MVALADDWQKRPRSHPIHFHGIAPAWTWLPALGYTRCPPAVQSALDALYYADSPPQALEHCEVFKFSLKTTATRDTHANIHTLPCIDNGTTRHVTTSLLAKLEAYGIPPSPRWRERWATLFGSWNAASGQRVALFPGAGHRLKQWPVERFDILANALANAGWHPFWVLGPVEIERGLRVPSQHESIRPDSLSELATVLRGARLVIGNDCGPLHLAALYGVSVLALFGPVDSRLWKPDGATILTPDIACAPCSRDTHDITCSHATCLDALPAARVIATALDMLKS